MLETALRYPYDDGDGLRVVLVGTVLTLLSFLVIPTILLIGYALRVIRHVTDGDDHPPAFDDWGTMFVDGLKGFVVTVVYFLVPSVLLTASVGVVLVPFVGGGSRGLAALGIVTLLAAFVSLPLFLVAAYVTPAALVGVALTDRLGAGFSPGTIWPVVTDGDYAIAWLLGFVVSLGAGTLTGVLTGTTLIGGLLGTVVSFYALVVSAYLYARGVADTGVVFDRPDPSTSADATEPRAD